MKSKIRTKEIRELTEMYLMIEYGECSADAFVRAFKFRFFEQIQKARNARNKREGYGWKTIDWDKVAKHPLLLQLLP